jgi:hypothetical protein
MEDFAEPSTTFHFRVACSYLAIPVLVARIKTGSEIEISFASPASAGNYPKSARDPLSKLFDKIVTLLLFLGCFLLGLLCHFLLCHIFLLSVD